MREFFRRGIWQRATERLYDVVSQLHVPRLWLLGLQVSFGALLWIAIPVTLMIIGQRP